jgi:hypothetical protein
VSGVGKSRIAIALAGRYGNASICHRCFAEPSRAAEHAPLQRSGDPSRVPR